jgi:hypothetical protein
MIVTPAGIFGSTVGTPVAVTVTWGSCTSSCAQAGAAQSVAPSSKIAVGLEQGI